MEMTTENNTASTRTACFKSDTNAEKLSYFTGDGNQKAVSSINVAAQRVFNLQIELAGAKKDQKTSAAYHRENVKRIQAEIDELIAPESKDTSAIDPQDVLVEVEKLKVQDNTVEKYEPFYK